MYTPPRCQGSTILPCHPLLCHNFNVNRVFRWSAYFVVAFDLVLLNIVILRRPATPTVIANQCQGCQDLITQSLSALPTPACSCQTLPTLSPASPTARPIVAPASSKTTAYAPIPGSGSVSTLTWQNIPGTDFYFNTADYPRSFEARFEANFRLFNGNGVAFVRLFDATVGIEVWGSEVRSSSQSFTTVVSPPLTFRPGEHLYLVQAKTLTADTTVFNSGRLKVTY